MHIRRYRPGVGGSPLESDGEVAERRVEQFFHERGGQGVEGGAGSYELDELEHEEKIARIWGIVMPCGGQEGDGYAGLEL